MALERAGVPTALVCSDEFAPLARAESRACGMSGEPLVVISHPLADNRPDEVARKASAIADELVSVLTEKAETLAERYRDRFVKPVERRVEAAVACTDEACIADVDRGPSRR
jgi:anion-transporting  ArsA/GET3 family ATPase